MYMNNTTQTTAPIPVLLLSGQNNHDWEKTTPLLKEMLESEGRFELTVTEEPWEMTKEQLKNYRLILSNWNSYGEGENLVTEWPETAKAAFVDFIRNGGGWSYFMRAAPPSTTGRSTTKSSAPPGSRA